MADACAAAGTLVYMNGAAEAGSVQRCADDLEAYVVGSGTTALIIGTDIFGFAVPNMRANADMLASALGCQVIIPDHFRGTTVLTFADGAEFSPAVIGPFIQKHGTWDQTKADLVDKVAPFAKATGASRLLYLGFCWGGKMALQIASDEAVGPLFRLSCGFAQTGTRTVKRRLTRPRAEFCGHS